MLVDTATKNKEWNTNSKEQVKADKKDAKNGSKIAQSLDTKSQISSLSTESKEDSASVAKGKEKAAVTAIPNGIDKSVTPPAGSSKWTVTTPQHTVSHFDLYRAISLHTIVQQLILLCSCSAVFQS